MERSFFVGTTRWDERVYVTVKTLDVDNTMTTVEHTDVHGYTRISLTGAVADKGARSASAAGQTYYYLEDLAPARGWTVEDVERLGKFWREWHLNDMCAGCVHTGEHKTTDITRIAPCAVTGYRYGHAWLLKPVTDDARATLAWLATMPTGRVPAYAV